MLRLRDVLRRQRAVQLTSSLTLLLALASPRVAAAQRDDEARALFVAGSAAFNDGRYEDALGYFQRAYDLSRRAEMLFNIGQAADRARHDEAALDAFERYLAGVTEISNRAEIEGRVRVLRAAILERNAQLAAAEEQRRTQAAPTDGRAGRASPETAPPRPDSAPASSAALTPDVLASPTPRGNSVDAGAVVLVTSGGVVAVAGAIMLGVGVPDIDGPREGEIYANAVSRQERASILVGAGGPLLGLGVVGAVVGAVLLATAPAGSTGPVALMPDGFSVSF